MTKNALKHKLHFLCLLLIATSAWAQSSSSSSSSSTPTPVSASSGTYSIEAEILAYKSLQVNSRAIATDVAAGLPIAEKQRPVHLLIVPSASTILPAFQQWRANMTIVQNFQDQYTQDKFADDECPVDQEQARAPSFSAYTTAIGEGVTALQSILSLFANSQAVTEYPGTIQDQALVTAVSRELKKAGFEILVPDVYTSWIVANVDSKKFPYLGQLADLIAKHGKLQKIYQCNTLSVSAGTQLQQAEIIRETDYSTLAAMDLTKPDAKPQPLLNEIANMKAQIDLLRGKIGIKPADVQTAENAMRDQGRIIADKNTSADSKQAALQLIQTAFVAGSQKENSILLQDSLRAAQAQSLVAGIESYLAGLTGGAVSLNSPAVPVAPVTATASAPATGGAAATASSTSPAGGSSSTPTASSPSASASSSATPPILTILQMDGLARRMGLPSDAKSEDCKADQPEKGHCPDNWRILWLKAMESGGADIAEASIFGSHPHFGGGAVSGYALFSLDGSLNCSGNVAAYGGYFKAKDFTKHGSSAAGGSPPTVMLSIDGGCAMKTENPAPTDQQKQ